MNLKNWECMDIKQVHKYKISRISLLLLFFTSLLLLVPLSSTISNPSFTKEEHINKPQLHTNSNSNVLVDKVYIFTVNDPTLTFDSNIYLERVHYYYISVKIVTPDDECHMRILILDPVGDPYEITNETDMVQDDLREIPFGTVLSGNYSFLFEAVLTDILNVHIRIEKGEKVLDDKIRPDETVLYNNVTKFKTGDVFEIKMYLESDKYYKILIERISTISLSLGNSSVTMDHDLWDPLQNQNKIFENENVTYSHYDFGTAMSGIYTFNLVVFLKAGIKCTNVAFALIAKGNIANIIDPNDPDPNPPEETPIIENPVINTTESKVEYFIPLEATIGVVVGCGIVVVFLIVIIVRRRGKNTGAL